MNSSYFAVPGRGGAAAGPRWDQIAQSGRKILVDGSAGTEVAGQKRDGEDDSKMARADWHLRTAGVAREHTTKNGRVGLSKSGRYYNTCTINFANRSRQSRPSSRLTSSLA